MCDLSRLWEINTRVRRASKSDLRELSAVEAAADELFLDLGVADLPAPATAQERARSWRVLVVGEPVQGFAVLELLDGAVHLEQLSVHPAHSRQGIGGALLAGSVEAAREHGADRVTLLTYADVPWNAPFYARHGRRTPSPPTTRRLAAGPCDGAAVWTGTVGGWR